MDEIVGQRVYVRQEDIRNGCTDEENCPVALALSRKFPKAKVIRVRGYSRSWIGNQTPSVRIGDHSYRVSQCVRNFVLDFDDNMKVQPFGFRILGRL